MKGVWIYGWLVVLLLVAIHGAFVVKGEWTVKSIRQHGALVEVKIEQLKCPEKLMTFTYGNAVHQKRIDAHTCAMFNEGQKIKLRHSNLEPDTFLFVNERNPNLFLLGGLEIAVGLLGLLANWPARRRKFVPR